ncbi:HotDog domain-containing protein [Peziza echinospora]|nr:HotDog domain-containing protein [Peziza echinospora]
MAPRTTPEGSPLTPTGTPIPGFTVDDERLSPLEKVKLFLEKVDAGGEFDGWGSTLFKDALTPISATYNPPSPSTSTSTSGHPPTPAPAPLSTAVFRLLILPSLANRLGNLHGGCTATIADLATTCALAPLSRKGYWEFAGVSHSLSVTYLRPAPVGSRVIVTAEVVSAGRNLAVLRAEFRDEQTGKVVALAEHGKASIDPRPAGGKSKL